MQYANYLVLAASAACFVAGSIYLYLKRRREAPLRRQAKAQRITFTANVAGRTRAPFGMWMSGTDMWDVLVRGDAVEISHSIAPIRVLFGQEWYFRACDLTVEVSKNRWNREWIAIEGRAAGRDVRLLVRDRETLRDIWDALVHAGAQPKGLPPAHGLDSATQPFNPWAQGPRL